MKRTTALLLLLPLIAACEIDLTGLDWSGLGGGAGYGGGGGGWGWDYTPMTVVVYGQVAIGPFAALDQEVTVELFDPATPSTPLALSVSSAGQYRFDLGASPGSRACTYQVRAVLWSGETTPLQPLFAPVPSPCSFVPGSYAGAPVQLPDYEPLAAPFAIEGIVFVDDRPAGVGEASIDVSMRGLMYVDSTRALQTDAQGRYRFETLDGAQRFALCRRAHARVRDGIGRNEATELGEVPPAECGSMRTLPDARIGTLKAATGVVHDAARNRGVGAGQVSVQLLRIDDGAAVGTPSTTLDDGSFHVWFPHGLQDPGCDWVLRLARPDGSSDVRALFESEHCQGTAYHYPNTSDFFDPHGGPLEVTVRDPAGDHTGPTDVTDMALRFDPQTGIYEVVLSADAAHPFQDHFRVNINLFDSARESFFDASMRDFNLATPTTTLRLTGFNAELRRWKPDDQVYTNSLGGTPNPPGISLFRSQVAHFPLGYLTNEDVIAFVDVATPALVAPAVP